MKKSYLKKKRSYWCSYLSLYRMEKKELSFIACEERSPHHLTSLSGDGDYFTFSECPGLYEDFIIRFGSNVSRETIQDIELFRVVKKDGKAIRYRYEFTICTEKNASVLFSLRLFLAYLLF